ncbi:MAG: ArsR/SmtB family transcription factor [Nocardioidaceae bacterium]
MESVDLPTVLHALADPVRLGLVRLLSDGVERGWGQLDAPIAKSTLSHHLKVLRAAGITRTREEGTRCFVRLRQPDLDQRFPGLLEPTLQLASSSGTGITHIGLREDT